ncbi:demethylrebeccamycin-D-glucose O-methyltransferase [Clostridium ragsdalei P11]|uniref:Demethylrebeccamycin-D-glucose O-methyltransferase n=1 Tax=Clostridium ragsdalei P11 TaxID=1353534 RepID=A0A1A6AML1_9CLOT|nr:class I SAM-dependent methyltransferase [Clostridium ragsdalei]OBR91296.1 demethylrebeccamycin-D-glucose O-methyltransferase [Clostridium ragsdalei P11]
MKCCNAYESDDMKNITGETLRPGGFTLTDKAVKFCKLSSKDSIMDLGCGTGATLNYLCEKYNISAVGLDPSQKLINKGKELYKNLKFICGKGEKIPFHNAEFNGVFAECTLSLMENLNNVIGDVFRILKPGGWFIITDVYARKTEFIHELHEISVNSCMRGLHNLDELKNTVKNIGFHVKLLEDCSDMLKELMVKTIFTYGSMSIFWNKVSSCSIDGCEFQQLLKNCKPGYFIMIAKKEDECYE